MITTPPKTAHTMRTAVLRLTRWNEHVLFTLPATLLGINMGLAHTAGVAPDLRALLVVSANVLAVAFAFMINDIEDAPDDARDPARGARNAVASGPIGPRTAWALTLATATLALALFALTGSRLFTIGTLAVGQSLLCCWRWRRRCL